MIAQVGVAILDAANVSESEMLQSQHRLEKRVQRSAQLAFYA
jgi:hypothetical protein